MLLCRTGHKGGVGCMLLCSEGGILHRAACFCAGRGTRGGVLAAFCRDFFPSFCVRAGRCETPCVGRAWKESPTAGVRCL
jgi:hypothetical protein